MNMNPQRNKRALVTGGNKGIGFAICQGLLTAGFEVTLAARSIDKAKAAISQLQSTHVQLLILDVDDDDSIDRAVAAYRQEFAQLDVLINNAGIYPDK
jgi:NAD(P)-dependent dehydrogenase (short-subunit alcohol dehydrogenase family)